MATSVPADYCSNYDNVNTQYCVEESQRAADTAFVSSLVVNAGLFLVFGIMFLIFYHMRRCRSVYVQHTDVPPPTRGLFGWARSALAVTNRDVEVKRGLDEAIYLAVLKYLFLLTVAFGVYGLAVLAPVHATAGGNRIGTAVIGVGNVPEGSARLTADLIGVFFNSIVAYIVLYALYRKFVAMRIRYRARNLEPENYTVMVREFPRTMTNDELRAAMDHAYPGAVAHVQRAYVSKSLWKHLDEREKVGLKLEDAQGKLRKKGERPTTRTMGPAYLCGPKTDAIDFFRGRFQAESAIVENKIALTMHDPAHLVAVAFVTFTSRPAAQLAAQSILRHHAVPHPLYKQWVTEYAAPPGTVNWRQLHVTHVSRWFRRLLVNILTILLVFFWMIPIAFASGLANMQTLSTVLPFLVPILSVVPAIQGFIEGFLPGLVVVIFFAILVGVIITNLARLEGNLRCDIEDRSIFSKYYLFLVFNVFFGSILASGVFSVLGQIIDNPGSIVSLLAKSLPGQVNYFLGYVMILSLSGYTLALWRPVDLIMRAVRHRFLASSKRAHRMAEGPYNGLLHVQMAVHLLIFIIVLVYSTLNPLIIPFGCIYFGLAYITGRYNIVYVYTPTREGQGSLFPSIFTRMMWSLIVYQVSLAGVLGLALFPAAAAIAVLVIATLFLWLYTDAQLHPVAIYGPLLHEGAAHVGAAVPGPPKEALQHLPAEPAAFYPSADTYQYPATRTPLFQLEDQDPAVERAPDATWWPITFREHAQGSEELLVAAERSDSVPSAYPHAQGVIHDDQAGPQ